MSYRGYWKRDWFRVSRRLWAEMIRDDVFGAAAQLAYSFLLAFFPFLVFLVGILASLQFDEVLIRKQDLLEAMERFAAALPGDAAEVVRRSIDALSQQHSGLLSLGALAALLAASSGMRPVMTTLNRAWGVAEGRSFGHRSVLSLAMTLVFVVLVMAGTILLSLSSRLDVWIAQHWGAGWATAWRLGSLAGGWATLLFVVEFIYHVAPNVRRPWRWITPGSLLAVLLWFAGVRLFSLYVSNWGRYELMYGSLGAAVVFLLWLYIAGLAVLVGGELNAELEKSAGIIAVAALPPAAAAEAPRARGKRAARAETRQERGRGAKPVEARPVRRNSAPRAEPPPPRGKRAATGSRRRRSAAQRPRRGREGAAPGGPE